MESAARKPGRSSMPLTVAVADGHSRDRWLLATVMEIEGHVVHSASNGSDALACLEQHRPDVAILDVAMPALSGMEVVAAAKGRAWGKHTVFIAVSDRSTLEERRAAKSAGFHFYLTKRPDLAVLRRVFASIKSKQNRVVASPVAP